MHTTATLCTKKGKFKFLINDYCIKIKIDLKILMLNPLYIE